MTDYSAADISHDMENISISMDEDRAPHTPLRLTQRFDAYGNQINKENVFLGTSPTKSVLYNSPSRPQARYAGYQINNQQQQQNLPPPSRQKPQLEKQQNIHQNITRLQPPAHERNKLSPAEIQRIANDPKTKRVALVAQIYFLDYYCDMFDYVITRRDRSERVRNLLTTDPALSAQPQRQQLEWKNYIGRERALLRKRRIKPKHRDFEIVTQVGQGGYGQVFLAKKKDTREVCALKVLNKNLLVRLDETRHVLTERDILTNTRSEWLVKLLYAFQDPEKVFLAMEFVPGGDFRTLLNNTGYLIPPHARFYISEMFAAVNLLHELGFTHRDLKPENFLIDAKGHIKLTDFGLAAGSVSNDRIESMRIRLKNLESGDGSVADDFRSYKRPSSLMTERQRLFKLSQDHLNLANSVVGSPDYMALEVLEGKNYDCTIDYWSLGCMLFEALCGYPPFSGSLQDETYYNLKHWQDSLRRPQTKDGRYVFSDRTWDLITKLITSPHMRLKNFNQVKGTRYFADIQNWPTLRTKTPPFTPQLDNEEDAGYFDDFDDEEMMAKYKDVFARQEQNEQLLDSGNSAKAKAKNNFVGFTFKHKSNPNNQFSGEINLLGMNVNKSNVTSSRLNPLATLY